ncbi:MAG TPA: sialate O-acetylesterase [Rhizomicrobium sp.]|jgi:hypothetical protein
MKRPLPALGLALCFLVAVTAFAHAANGPVDVFLISGQSNALGEGNAAQAPPVAPGTVLQFFHNQIEPGSDPVGGASSGSAWPAFGNAYYAINNRRVLFVPFAFGSTAQEAAADVGAGNWDTGSTLLADSMTEVDIAMTALIKAGYTPAFKGVLWVQGEADGLAMNQGKPNVSAANYEAALKRMIASYRARFGGTMPFYIFRTGTQVGASDAGYHAVREAQEDVGQSDPNTYVVFRNAYDFWWRLMMSSDVHYTQAAYNEMGAQSAANISFYRQHNVGPKPPGAFPGSGTYATVTNVTLASALATSILYTLDGSTPTCTTGTHYTGSFVIPTGAPTLLQAIGCRAGLASPVANYAYNYTVSFPSPLQASPPPGTYTLGMKAAFSSPNATYLRYYWTGPAIALNCEGGTAYTGPIALSQSHHNLTVVACNGPYGTPPQVFDYTITYP